MILLSSSGFITLNEVARFLNVRRESIKRWAGGWFRDDGKVSDFPQPIKKGRHWAWRVEEVIDFLERRYNGEERMKRDGIRIEEELLKTSEVAEIAGVSLSTVRSWLYKGWLPYIRLSWNVVRVRKEDLLRFLEEREARGRLGRKRKK